MSKTHLKKASFLRWIFVVFGSQLGSQNRTSNSKIRVFFVILGQLGPTWAKRASQEAPRAPKWGQEASPERKIEGTRRPRRGNVTLHSAPRRPTRRSWHASLQIRSHKTFPCQAPMQTTIPRSKRGGFQGMAPRGAQERPKSAQERPKSVPRAILGSILEPPGSISKSPGIDFGGLKPLLEWCFSRFRGCNFFLRTSQEQRNCSHENEKNMIPPLQHLSTLLGLGGFSEAGVGEET